MQITIPKTHFAAGETLRVTVGAVKPNDGVFNLGMDPADIAAQEDDSSINIPFRIDN